ncbi:MULTISPECIES: peptidylprolyl isomerase [Stenotrophomonas]|uniref:peptidylprolyl isomerase n=1 Tax=Stenotrophomonas TaxID=40323 RepID=UPI000C14520A|nr:MULTISPECIES: peptidylprolyl isomerase [Stenotrophomonas]MBA0380586.1 rotamase [Stenotrophomonas maltophilia]MBA0426756.1 rotamase [Stenotrophomonas maltophilia]
MGSLPRILPITVIDSDKSVPAEAGHHHEQDAGTRGLGQPAPCSLYVQDTAINEADIAREMQFHRAMRPEQSRADAARALVVRELLRLEAERLGLADVPGAGQETSEEARIQQLIEQTLEDRVPSEDDCQRYFAQNPEKFRAPDRIRVRHILLAAPADDIAGRLKARTQAEKLIAELLEQPHVFADLAARHSQCPSSSEGGELGWLQRGQTTPEFDRQVFRLRQGLAGFPVESRWGYHVVDVVAAETGEALGFEQVRAQISDYLELQVRQRDLQQFLLELRERYPVRGLEDIEAQAE